VAEEQILDLAALVDDSCHLVEEVRILDLAAWAVEEAQSLVPVVGTDLGCIQDNCSWS